MSVSPEFEQDIQHWVKYDNAIKLYQSKIKELQQSQKQTEDNILNYMELNKLQKTPININGGKLTYNLDKRTGALTFTFLQQCCVEYFKENTNADAEEISKQLISFIKKKRPISQSVSLRRKKK